MCNTPLDKNFIKECSICFSHTWSSREKCSQEMQMSVWSTTGQLLTTRLNCLIFHYTDSHFSCKSNKRHSYPIIISYISAHMIQTEIENPRNFFSLQTSLQIYVVFFCFSFVFYSKMSQHCNKVSVLKPATYSVPLHNHSTYSGSLCHTHKHTHTHFLSLSTYSMPTRHLFYFIVSGRGRSSLCPARCKAGQSQPYKPIFSKAQVVTGMSRFAKRFIVHSQHTNEYL